MRPLLSISALPLALACGCGPHAPGATGPDSPAAGAGKPEPARVAVVHPQRRTLRREIEQPGRVEAFAQTPVYAKVAGFVQEVKADIGDRVRGPRRDGQGRVAEEGQVLARVSMPELEEELEQKRQLVAQADAEVRQAEAASRAAEANVESAAARVGEAEAGRGRARGEFERWSGQLAREEDLARRGVIERQGVEETRNQLASARSARDEAEAKVQSARAAHAASVAQRNKAEADVGVARAKRGVAEADRRRVAALLGYATVRAPFDGVVSRRQVDVGHFLQSAAGGAKGEPLFVVTQLDPVRLFVEVPEADAVYVADGAAARVRVPALRGAELAGTVTRSSWSLDGRTRTLRAEIDLPNKDGRLRPGMYAYAAITLTHPDLLTLPAAAVVTQGDTTFCMRVVGGKAVRTPVQFGLTGGGLAEVLKRQVRKGEQAVWEDFSPDDEVVAENAAALADGQEVAVAR